MGFGSWLKKGFNTINPISAGAGVLGGALGAWGANNAAKASAANQNAMNSWKSKLDAAQYGTERMPYYRQGSKMRSWRDSLMRGVMRNPKNGLNKLFAGWDQGKATAFDPNEVRQVEDPYAVAGPPPQLKAETGGWKSVLGGALSGLG